MGLCEALGCLLWVFLRVYGEFIGEQYEDPGCIFVPF